MSDNIEVELRSFLSEKQYESLQQFFMTEAQHTSTSNQTTLYFSGPKDLRLQYSKTNAKLWLKQGALHTSAREEKEIILSHQQAIGLESILNNLGFATEIIWKRHRQQFQWNTTTVCLDNTERYGYILELERLCTPAQQQEALAVITQQFQELDIIPTSITEQNRRFQEYKRSWKSRIER